MPKILRIINRLNLGGPTYNAALLSKHLAPQFETHLVAGMKDDTEASSEFIVENLGLSPTYVPNMYRSINPIKDLPAYRQIKQLIQDFKPDIVHTHAAKAGALGRLAAYECGVPVIVHTFHGHVFHSYFNPFKTRLFLEIERWLAKVSHQIIAISPKQREELQSIYKVAKADKISTIPLGFDLSRFQNEQVDKRITFRQEYKIADDEIAIGIVGRVVPIKNHDLFLKALKKVVQNTNKKVRAFIIGDGEERGRIEQLVKDLQLTISTPDQPKGQVTFTSWITDIDIAYAGLDIVALSSLNEGTPVSLIEAQAANKPIITTEVGGVCDVVCRNKTALLSPSNDVEKFARNLQKLVESRRLRQKIGKRGHIFVAQKYSYQRLAKDMSNLYHKLLLENAPAYRQQPIPAFVKMPSVVNG